MDQSFDGIILGTGVGGGQDRQYRVPSFQIQGPFNPKGVSDTPSRHRIFSCRPAAGAAREADQNQRPRNTLSSSARSR